MQRSIAPYCPFADAAERWPDWSFKFTDLDGIACTFSVRHKKALFDQQFWQGREPDAVARFVAHLDLGHHELDRMEAEHKARGRWLAQVRLDRDPLDNLR